MPRHRPSVARRAPVLHSGTLDATPDAPQTRRRRVAAVLLGWGPHRGAHRVALRAGVSVLVPLLALVLAGRVESTAYAAFGAFTSLYGRNHGRAERAGMQIVDGTFLTVTVVLGVAVSLMAFIRVLRGRFGARRYLRFAATPVEVP
ncbi:hypothetical protein [Humibacillus xanthopallidus]|uniref:hypothetical protein n=1 Tax=Humibacillus xanthopallidus TaxID=412689 RepID=UPI00163A0BA7|nr:hypothetical protein [Humibacillus xanthopallidus]